MKNDQQEISISAAGAAISKAVQLAEIVKRRIGGLYQVNKLFSQEMSSKPKKDEGTQQNEGEDKKDSKDSVEPIEVMRHVSVIEIKLSKVELDTTAFGYQKPVPREAPGKFTDRRFQTKKKCKTTPAWPSQTIKKPGSFQ
jgi:DNA-binding protein